MIARALAVRTAGVAPAIWLVVFVAPAWAQLCPGDSKENQALTNTSVYGQVQTWARTRLLHGPAHTGCAGIVGANAQLWLESTFTGCQTGIQNNAAATATSSPANHEKTVSKWCTMYLCSGAYQARGRHYFNITLLETKMGNLAEGGCGGSGCTPCTPGYVEGGSCALHQQDSCGCCPDASPIVIDRSGNGFDFSSAEDGALFDINGYGSMFWLGWPASADDAWLALDRNGNGIIDNGAELFGNTRNLRSGVNARHGYEVLAELDDNGDGVIDAQDAQFSSLLLWGDANRNGVGEPREHLGVVAAGIRLLSLDYRESRRRGRWGNQFRYVATDGSSADVFPVWRLPDSKLEEPPR